MILWWFLSRLDMTKAGRNLCATLRLTRGWGWGRGGTCGPSGRRDVGRYAGRNKDVRRYLSVVALCVCVCESAESEARCKQFVYLCTCVFVYLCSDSGCPLTVDSVIYLGMFKTFIHNVNFWNVRLDLAAAPGPTPTPTAQIPRPPTPQGVLWPHRCQPQRTIARNLNLR